MLLGLQVRASPDHEEELDSAGADLAELGKLEGLLVQGRQSTNTVPPVFGLTKPQGAPRRAYSCEDFR